MASETRVAGVWGFYRWLRRDLRKPSGSATLYISFCRAPLDIDYRHAQRNFAETGAPCDDLIWLAACYAAGTTWELADSGFEGGYPADRGFVCSYLGPEEDQPPARMGVVLAWDDGELLGFSLDETGNPILRTEHPEDVLHVHLELGG